MNLRLGRILKRIRKNRKIIIGCIFISSGIFLIGWKFLQSKVDKIQNLEKVEQFIEEQTNNSEQKELNNSNINSKQEDKEKYIAVIEIPEIKLKRGIYSKDSVLNDVNKNIQILKESSFPDEEGGNVILAAHSGTGKVAYFSNLIKLQEGDIVNIYYNNILYEYKIESFYEVNKTGTIELEEHSSSILTLITCNQNDKTKQIVLICKQIKKGK